MSAPITVNGLLRPDGTLLLDSRPELPAGRVRVTLQVLKEIRSFPDPPAADESISAPFDLPYLNEAKRVHPRPIGKRWPEKLDWSAVDTK